jgi:hypothetical protein
MMRRTRLADLLVPFVILAASCYVLLRVSYDSLPPLQYLVPAPLAALALAELMAARRVRGVVRHDPNARPMPAIVVARWVALGKASSLVGAGVTGAAVALLARLLPDAGTVQAAAHDAKVAGLLLGAALLLVAAGLLLERAGTDPGSRRHDR